MNDFSEETSWEVWDSGARELWEDSLSSSLKLVFPESITAKLVKEAEGSEFNSEGVNTVWELTTLGAQEPPTRRRRSRAMSWAISSGKRWDLQVGTPEKQD